MRHPTASHVVGVVVLLAFVAALQAADLAGTWVGTTEVPDSGTDRVTLVLKRTKDAYAGTLTDSLGMVSKDEIKDVKVAGTHLSFVFTLTDGVVMTMRLEVTGDRMAGQWEHPDGTVGAIALERK